jgi:cyclopropane fatty-acyl-phospholipid synthase-like methyltransferase
VERKSKMSFFCEGTTEEQAYLKEADVIMNFIQQCMQSYEWRNRQILDFGCGGGMCTLKMSQKLPDSQITGVDVLNAKTELLKFMKTYLKTEVIPDNLKFIQIAPGEALGFDVYDLVYSWSVIEHVDQTIIDQVLRHIYNCIKPDGLFFLQIMPLYYSAFGHHLYHVNIDGFEHLAMQDDILISKVRKNCSSLEMFENVVSRYRALNRITVPELKKHFQSAGFMILREYTTNTDIKIMDELLYAYNYDALLTEQVVLLGQKL